MQTFRDLSIKRKLTLLGVATSVVVLLLASIVFAVHEYMAFRDDTVAHRESAAFIVGSNCIVTLTFEDPKIAAELLSALEKQPLDEPHSAHSHAARLPLHRAYLRLLCVEDPPRRQYPAPLRGI